MINKNDYELLLSKLKNYLVKKQVEIQGFVNDGLEGKLEEFYTKFSPVYRKSGGGVCNHVFKIFGLYLMQSSEIDNEITELTRDVEGLSKDGLIKFYESVGINMLSQIPEPAVYTEPLVSQELTNPIINETPKAVLADYVHAWDNKLGELDVSLEDELKKQELKIDPIDKFTTELIDWKPDVDYNPGFFRPEQIKQIDAAYRQMYSDKIEAAKKVRSLNEKMASQIELVETIINNRIKKHNKDMQKVKDITGE